MKVRDDGDFQTLDPTALEEFRNGWRSTTTLGQSVLGRIGLPRSMDIV